MNILKTNFEPKNNEFQSTNCSISLQEHFLNVCAIRGLGTSGGKMDGYGFGS